MKDFWIYGRGRRNARQEPAEDIPGSSSLTCRTERFRGWCRGTGKAMRDGQTAPPLLGPGRAHPREKQNFLMPDSCTGEEGRDEQGVWGGFDAQHPGSCIPTLSKAGWRCRTGAEGTCISLWPSQHWQCPGGWSPSP